MEENNITKVISKMIFDIKTESLQWNKTHQDEILLLKENELINQRKVEQKLEEMAISFKGEKERKQIEETYKTKQFQEFLLSIEEMKNNILKYYSDSPKPIALMIHNKATELLSQAWHNKDFTIKKINQTKLMELMIAVYEDMYNIKDCDTTAGLLPQKSLDYIYALDV